MVTIGLPVYNGEKWLKEALESVASQTFVDWELIVIDDGSADDSVRCVAESVAYPYVKVRVISDGQHLGIAARLNQMVGMAKGEFFARMDADDIMKPTRLEKQVAFMTEHPEVDVVSSSAVVIDEQGNRLGERTGHLIHPTVMGRTEWFRQNPYNEAYSGVEDYELWLRVKGSATIAHINEPLMLYRERTSYDIKKVWHERVLGIRMIWHERHLYGSLGRTLWQIGNNLCVMIAVPIIHLLHLDMWMILRRNS